MHPVRDRVLRLVHDRCARRILSGAQIRRIALREVKDGRRRLLTGHLNGAVQSGRPVHQRHAAGLRRRQLYISLYRHGGKVRLLGWRLKRNFLRQHSIIPERAEEILQRISSSRKGGRLRLRLLLILRNLNRILADDRNGACCRRSRRARAAVCGNRRSR